MRRVKVLCFIGTLAGGGAERFFATVLNRLDRSRFEAVLVLITREIQYSIPSDVPVIVLGKARPWHVPVTIFRLARILEAEKPDVMISSVSFYNLIAGEAIRLVHHKPHWIARIAADPVHTERGLIKFRAKRAYRLADTIVTNSHGLSDGFRRTYPFLTNRVCVVKNPIEFDQNDRLAAETPKLSLPEGNVIVTLGRLDKLKRHDLLIEAFASVRSVVESHLVLLGQGPEDLAIRQRVKQLGLADCVLMPGFCDNPFSVMARADLFVQTSDSEGLPNALIEAQGLGLAAVATDCPYGPAEIIVPEKTGILVPPGDAESLAAAMIRLLTDPPSRHAMGKAARKRARSLFSAHQIVPTLEELFEQAAVTRFAGQSSHGRSLARKRR